jgi:hypothetical protein
MIEKRFGIKYITTNSKKLIVRFALNQPEAFQLRILPLHLQIPINPLMPVSGHRLPAPAKSFTLKTNKL